jgi:DNA modification methylase
MELYSSNDSYKLYKGDMRNMLDVIKKESIDAVLTDPPYELNFMGKGWDNSGIAFQPDTWKKCYEVLKPGGYLLAFGGSRTFHRIACAIEDAGFEIRDTIMWIYGMGFPKSQNIGKQLEKRLEDEKTKQKTEHDLRLMWERDIQKTMRNEEEQNEVLQSQLQKQSLQVSGKTTSDVWGEQSSMERWSNIQKTERELQRCKVCEMSKRVSINGEKRWICNGTQACDGKTLREMFEQSGSCASYRPQSEQQQDREPDAIQEQCRTQESREVIEYWNKFGTALKPSFEPIIVARKPFKGSLVDNVIEYGVGGINIDECRVGNEIITQLQKDMTKYHGNKLGAGHHTKMTGVKTQTIGRFPANTILTYDETDFDEVCGGFPTSNKPNGNITKKYKMNNQVYGDYGYCNTWEAYQDSGSASRYFYCAKASKKDRDEGCQDLEDTVNACSNQAIAELKRGNDNFSDETNSTFNKVYKGKNTHPTVKPTDLMQYLVRLVTPNGGIILDPFNGSGSTGKAVMYENHDRNKNYKYIGIELTEEYLPIAKARIEYVCNLKEEKQTTIDEFLD